jgi:hypothetical protein
MFLILFPGQLQQVLERELAVDLGLGKPPPPRYPARVTPALDHPAAPDPDDGRRSGPEPGSVGC